MIRAEPNDLNPRAESHVRHEPIRRLLRTLALATALAGPGGCFRYVPTPIEAVPPGGGVRVLMTRQGATEIAEVTEVSGDVPSIDGRVVGLEGETLLLRVPVGQRQAGFVTRSLDQTVRVPRGEILSFQRREVNALATGLFIGAGVGLATAIVVFIVKPFGGDTSNPDPPGPDDLHLRLGILSVPIGE